MDKEDEQKRSFKPPPAPPPPPPPPAPVRHTSTLTPHASLPAASLVHHQPRKGPHHDHHVRPHQQQQPMMPAPTLLSTATQSSLPFMGYMGLPMTTTQPSPNLISQMAAMTAPPPPPQDDSGLLVVPPQPPPQEQPQQASKSPPTNQQQQQQQPQVSLTNNRGKKKRPRYSKRRRSSSSRKSTPSVTIVDDEPKRLVNPLLELPYCSDAPQASDLHLYSSIVFHRPDTYPLAYYARLLGFNVPASSSSSSTFTTFSPSTLPVVQDSSIHAIPKLGTWHAQTKKTQGKLDHVDPFYTSLLQEPLKHTLATGVPRPSDDLLYSVLEQLPVDSPTLVPSFKCPQEGRCSMTYGAWQIDYTFCWMDATNTSSTTDTPSTTTMPKVSELVLYVEDLEKMVHHHDSTEASGDQGLQLIVCICLVLEHARFCHVWYGVWRIQKSPWEHVLEHYFAMEHVAYESAEEANPTTIKVTMVCDLHQCSTRLVGLLYQQKLVELAEIAAGVKKTKPSVHHRRRMLVRLPAMDDVVVQGDKPLPKRKSVGDITITSAKESVRQTAFGVRVSLDSSNVQVLNDQGDVVEEGAKEQDSSLSLAAPNMSTQPWDVLKVFKQVIPEADNKQDDEDDEILRDMKQKQSELAALEGGMEPKVRSLLKRVMDLRMDYEKEADSRQEDREKLESYKRAIKKRKDEDEAAQKRLEQDMDAVCEICRDGEVTPDNQILFCEACNVAIHQMCYGIEQVPEGDYYCIACRYFNREKISQTVSAPSPQLPICCELCPRKQGAFVRSANDDPENNRSKWVHVVCAKWQGLNFEPLDQTEVVEDVQELKKTFLGLGYKCILCLGRRGAYQNCREEGCESWMHITCARSSGLCEVVHGENCNGPVEDNPWTLLCPEHSTTLPGTVRDRVSIDELVQASEEFPPEPIPEPPKPPPMPFNKMSGKQRREFLADPEYEQGLLEHLDGKLHGVHCEVCHQWEEDGKNLTRCSNCNVVFCASCVLPVDVQCDPKEYVCPACLYVEEKTAAGEEFETPQCHMCFQRGGWLRPAYGYPVNRKTYWRDNPREYARTLFAKDLWCHALCTMWHPLVTAGEDGKVDCSNIIMTNGMGHIKGNVKCALCGETRRMKVGCSEEGCRAWGQKRGPYSFHVTCAREAGLEVKDRTDAEYRFYFDTKCFRHSGSDFVFRARLEDLIEVERRRAGKKHERASHSMSMVHASRLYNKSIVVMKMLGWAWRWAEWWVENADNWEPLLEPGEVESRMTKKQLKIVESTRESRCEAARRCRLAALGAALRNRDYDEEEGDDTVALDRALRALLHTPELVGPLEPFEIDFFADWLGRAYRSKSRLLGFGEDKIPIKDTVGTLHIEDNSPKYILGSRRLPGKQELPEGEVFETDFTEVDDFLKPETYPDGSLVTAESLPKRTRKRVRGPSDGKRKRGRKPKRRKLLQSGTEDFGVGDSELADQQAPVLEGTGAWSSSNDPTAVPKRRGRPPKSADGKPRKRGRKPKSPESGFPAVPKRRGRPPKSPADPTLSAPKRRGRPPKSPSSAKPGTPKRRGRPPKSSKSPLQEQALPADAGPSQLEGGVGIAERIKTKRRSTVEVLPSHAAEMNVRTRAHDRIEQQLAGVGGFLSDDDIPISLYVQEQKLSRGEKPTAKNLKPDSSDDSSSDYEPEVVIDESRMTPAERGRKRGKKMAADRLLGRTKY